MLHQHPAGVQPEHIQIWAFSNKPHQSDSFIALCQVQPPQHATPAPDQQRRSKLCRKPHLNFIWAAHLLSLTVTEKTWFQSAPVPPSIHLKEWRGRIYSNSRKGRRTKKVLLWGIVMYCAGWMRNLAVWYHVFLPHFISFCFSKSGPVLCENSPFFAFFVVDTSCTESV